MFDIFKDVPDNELKIIYNDILKSEDEGITPKSLNIYAKKLEDICKFETSSQAINLAKELFLKEIAKRYFNATQRSEAF